MMFKKVGNALIPFDEETVEWFEKLQQGCAVHGKLTQPRNLLFLRKFFKMLRIAYDNNDWPEVQTPYGEAKCSFKIFRKFCIVKAGFFEIEVTPEGNLKYEPKSIAFANMDEDEFQETYSAVLDVVLQRFLTNWQSDDMDRAVQEYILGFA